MSKALDKVLTREERLAVDAFATALYRQYPDRIQDVILFGSKARGEGHPDSDIDILILVDDDNWRFSHAISRLAARVSLNYDVLLGPRVIRQARWQRSLLYPIVSSEGIPLALPHRSEPSLS
jgi:predicted nucleotidyltransferase